MIPMMSQEETAAIVRKYGLPERVGQLNLARILLKSEACGVALFNFLIALMQRNTLSVSIRELVILRVAWLSKSEYEFSHHVRIARGLKVNEDKIMGVRDPDRCKSYDEVDRAVIGMTDDLMRGTQIAPQKWAVLEKSFDRTELNELLFVVGFWRMMACWLHAAEPPLEHGEESWPGGERPS